MMIDLDFTCSVWCGSTLMMYKRVYFKFKDPPFTKSDLNLLQLIKAGKEGVFYQARMTRGTCKGHSMFTCKISKEGEDMAAGLPAGGASLKAVIKYLT